MEIDIMSRICSHIAEGRYVSISDMSKRLGYTIPTIRRYLDHLESRGFINVTRCIKNVDIFPSQKLMNMNEVLLKFK